MGLFKSGVLRKTQQWTMRKGEGSQGCLKMGGVALQSRVGGGAHVETHQGQMGTQEE